ncbi:hypothetical protein Q4512_03635 [Oceanihabitans sp. 2_MG-2023]|uniref:hypothetical protein n=1 Tax=Oceanihabitans sp. 2_MG-2023 TaxID=3062661 RepID=UPI0026E1CC45|nr:hypothetical protein [Oceanihabitans sp. 2_MG-2023]MDO6595991.1 hypothetical protein [Oceanihabitans sp. 2_MG-2023]
MLKTEVPSLLFLNKISRKLFKNEKNNTVENNTYPINIDDEKYSLKTMEKYALNKNIRNLEFINHLEMNLQDKQLKNMPLEFLTDLKQLKIHSQNNLLTTLYSINKK